MKRLLLFTILFYSYTTFSQTSTFSSSENTGIGVTNPANRLQGNTPNNNNPFNQLSFFGAYSLKSDNYLSPFSFKNNQAHYKHTQICLGVGYRFNRFFELTGQIRSIHKRGLQAGYTVSKSSGGGSSPLRHHTKRYTASQYTDIVGLKIEPTLILERNNIFGSKSQIRFGIFWQLDVPVYQKEIKGTIFEYKATETYPHVYQKWDTVYPSNASLFKIRPTNYTGISIAQNWYIKNFFIQIQYACFISWKTRYKSLMNTISSYGYEVSFVPYNEHRLIFGFGSEVSLIFGWSDLNNKIAKKKG